MHKYPAARAGKFGLNRVIVFYNATFFQTRENDHLSLHVIDSGEIHDGFLVDVIYADHPSIRFDSPGFEANY